MYQDTLIIGNVGDPGELKYMPDGEAVIVFTVKTTRRFRDFDTVVKTEVTWWRISAWRKLAEWCKENLHNNTWVRARGRLSPDEKTGGPRIMWKRDGKPAACFELVLQEISLMGGVAPEPEDVPLEMEEE